MSAVRQAVVLAAGRGTRMGELTAGVPKPMLPVRGRPMLEHVLDRLASAGVERFLLVTGYRRDVVEEHFRSWRVPVEFVVQERTDGTASAARLARPFAGGAPVLLTFGDILCSPEAYVRCAAALVEQPGTLAVVGVRDVEDPWRGAAVYVEDGLVRRIVEKPAPGASTTRWNSAGLFGLAPAAFDYLDRVQPSVRGEYELTSAFELMIAEGRDVRVSEVSGDWRDVGYPEDWEAVNRQS